MRRIKIRKITAYLAAGALAAALLTGCGQSSGQNSGQSSEQNSSQEAVQTEPEVQEAGTEAEAPEQNKGTISVTYVKSPLNVPSIVEKKKGVFAEAFGKEGYEVSYSDLTTGPEQTQALASGDIQFLNAVGATSVILAASNDADIKILSTYSRSPKAFKLFSADDSIEVPEDLKGKKVAGPKGTILHELLNAYLTSAGMTENDIEFLAMDIPSSQAALAGGSVDAALLAGPVAYNMEQDGFHVVTDGVGLTDATIVTAASGTFCEEHPELVEVFLEAQKQILDYMDTNYDECMTVAAEETELSEDAVKEMYGMYDFRMEITEDDIAAMEKTKQFMLGSGMIENDVDISSLLRQGR